MGEFLSYSIMSGLYMLAMYLAYRLFLARDNQHVFNRCILLLIYFVSFVVTPIVFSIEFGTSSPTVSILSNNVELINIALSAQDVPIWPTILIWMFLIGMVVTLIKTIATWLRLFNVIRTGHKIKQNGYTLVVTSDQRYAPFSWMSYIVISRSDYENGYSSIITHELKHVTSLHWLDLLVAQCVCIINWFNPAAWLMRDELMLVHEYQADMAVIKEGYDSQVYQLLLIKKAVGARFPSLANSLNHSKLKKRITMMYNQKRVRGGRMLRPLLLLPALGAALWLMNLPAVASAMDSIAESSLVAPSAETSAKITKFISNPEQISSEKSTSPSPMEAPRKEKSKSQKESKTFMAVDKVADFPGGMSALMNFLKENIKYPEGSSATGRVIVRFVVEANGSIGDVEIVRSVSPELDAEAERVVKLMPRWTPGEVNGKPVASYFNLPVSFKTEPTPKSDTTDQGKNEKNGFLSKSFSTSTTADGQTQTTVTITSRSEDGSMSVSTSSTGGDQPRYEVYVDGKKFEGDLSEISSSSIDSMKIDQTDDNPAKIYITLKK